MTDYEKALKSLDTIPKYHIGQEINTIFGKGIIVEICMPFNGLYIEPNKSTVVVWFSAQDSRSIGTFTGSYSSRIFDINEVDVRQLKLDSL